MGLYVTHVEAREEVKTKKTRFRKCGFFVVCPYGPLLCHPCGGKGGGKNEKTRLRKCVFFVVCPYGPLCHPCGGQGRSIYTGQSYTKQTFTSEIFLRQKSSYTRSLCLCRFGALWSSTLVHVYCELLWYHFHCLQIFVPLLALFTSHADVLRVKVHVSCKRFTIWT